MTHSFVPTSLSEKIMFLYKFLQSPRQVGSILPSSPFLANEMMKPINWHQARHIAELGAGTGVFTRAIEQNIHPDCHVFVFEQDLQMRRQLSKRFPSFSLHDDAANLPRVLQEKSWPKLDAILSGLPFANFSQVQRDQILDGVLDSLQEGGLFITFQYSLQMKSQLQERFSSVRTSFVPLNVPPAFIYVCRK